MSYITWIAASVCLAAVVVALKRCQAYTVWPIFISAVVLLVAGVVKLELLRVAVISRPDWALALVGHEYTVVHLPHLNESDFEDVRITYFWSAAGVLFATLAAIRTMPRLTPAAVVTAAPDGVRVAFIAVMMTCLTAGAKVILGVGMPGRPDASLPLKLEAILNVLNVYFGPLLALTSVAVTARLGGRPHTLCWILLFVGALVNYAFFASKMSLAQPIIWMVLLSVTIESSGGKRYQFTRLLTVGLCVAAFAAVYPSLNLYRNILNETGRSLFDSVEILRANQRAGDFGSGAADSALSGATESMLQIIGRMTGADSLILVQKYRENAVNGLESLLGGASFNAIYTDQIFALPNAIDAGFAPSLIGTMYIIVGSSFVCGMMYGALAYSLSAIVALWRPRGPVNIAIICYLVIHLLGAMLDGPNVKQIIMQSLAVVGILALLRLVPVVRTD